MKKISFLIGSLGGGGAERVTVALADYFCESGYKVFFIVLLAQVFSPCCTYFTRHHMAAC